MIWSYAVLETFNTLTSGKIIPRPTAKDTARALRYGIASRATVLHLMEEQILKAFDEAEVRGGTLFDYLHLAVARAHPVERLYTLNTRHFQSFWRAKEPEIAHP